VRHAYRQLATREPRRIVLIDGSRLADEIEIEIWETISTRFSRELSIFKSKIKNQKSKIL
jgi:thymidylate kinase